MLRSFGYAARLLRPLGTWLIVATVATGLISLTACAEGCGPYSLGRYFSLLVDVVFSPVTFVRTLGVLFGEVVLEDAGGGCPSERSVGSVVIVEVDEPVVGGSALGF